MTSSPTSTPPVAVVSEGSPQLLKVEEQIVNVESEINRVQEQIEKARNDAAANIHGDKELFLFLNEHVKRLSNREELLRKKEEQLHNEKLILLRSRPDIEWNDRIDNAVKTQVNNALSKQGPMSRRQSSDWWLQMMANASTDIPLFQERLQAPLPIASSSSAVSIATISEMWSSLSRTLAAVLTREDLHELRDRKSETVVQKMMNEVHGLLAQYNVRFRDTSRQFGPTHPYHKFDHCLVPAGSSSYTSRQFGPTHPYHKFDHCLVPAGSSSSLVTQQVIWSDVILAEQLKKDLQERELVKEAQLQAAEDMQELFNKQPQREFAMGFISDGWTIQFYFQPNSSPVQISTSGKIDFLTPLLSLLLLQSSSSSSTSSSSSPSPRLSDGFILYASMLHCSPQHLGLPGDLLPPSLPPELHFPGFDLDLAAARALRPGRNSKPTIFSINQTWIVKAYPYNIGYKQEREILNKLSASRVADLIPRLEAFCDKRRCLLITPVAPRTLEDARFNLELFKDAVRVGNSVLSAMHELNLAHGDVTPSNFLVISDPPTSSSFSSSPAASASPSSSSSSSASSFTTSFSSSSTSSQSSPSLCLLNDFGLSGELDELCKGFAGTHEFAAPAWGALAVDPLPHAEVKRSALLDYTGLFFTLLFYAQHSKHWKTLRLPWAHPDLRILWFSKLRWLDRTQRRVLLRHVDGRVKPFLSKFASLVLDSLDVEKVKTFLSDYIRTPRGTIDTIQEVEESEIRDIGERKV